MNYFIYYKEGNSIYNHAAVWGDNCHLDVTDKEWAEMLKGNEVETKDGIVYGIDIDVDYDESENIDLS